MRLRMINENLYAVRSFGTKYLAKIKFATKTYLFLSMSGNLLEADFSQMMGMRSGYWALIFSLCSLRSSERKLKRRIVILTKVRVLLLISFYHLITYQLFNKIKVVNGWNIVVSWWLRCKCECAWKCTKVLLYKSYDWLVSGWLLPHRQ